MWLGRHATRTHSCVTAGSVLLAVPSISIATTSLSRSTAARKAGKLQDDVNRTLPGSQGRVERSSSASLAWKETRWLSGIPEPMRLQLAFTRLTYSPPWVSGGCHNSWITSTNNLPKGQMNSIRLVTTPRMLTLKYLGHIGPFLNQHRLVRMCLDPS